MAELFSGPFEPSAWRGAIWAITSVFESGSPEGNPAAFQNFDEGVISYGKHQATLASGNLSRVLSAYFQRSQSPVSQALEQEFGQRIRNRDATLRHNSRLKQLLLQAAEEPAMIQAQDDVFETNFYEPSVEQSKRLGLRSPLSLSCVYDTLIQGGLTIVANAVAARLGGSGVGRIGLNGVIEEGTWVKTFLDEREQRLLRLADRAAAQGKQLHAQALRISTFRVTELRRLVEEQNWGLEGEFAVRGQRIRGIVHPEPTEPAEQPVTTLNAAKFVAFRSSADLNAVPEGSSFSNTWRIRNSGSTIWRAGYQMVHINEASGSHLMAAKAAFPLAEVGDRPTVAPGEEVAITINMVAPAVRDRLYFSDWQMQDAQGKLFGDILFVRAVVVKGPLGGGNFLESDSAFVDDITVPDDTPVPAGKPFIKQWLVRNTGERKWGSGYRLVYVGGDAPMTGTLSHLVPEAGPGDEVVITVPMVAPTLARPEAYISHWRIHDDRNIPFGNRLWVKVFVTGSEQPLPTTRLSQNDSRWKNQILGHGPRTFGEFGCLVVCYTMLLNAYGVDLTPLEVNERFLALPSDQGFDGSVIRFVAPAKAFEHIEFEGNFKPQEETGAEFATFDPALISKVDRKLSEGVVVLAQVDTTPSTAYHPDVDQHWVLLVARTGSDYLIIDPLDGKETSLLAKYGQQNSPQDPEEALKQAIKSVLFYRSTRKPEPVAVRLETGMNINPDDSVSNPVDSDVLRGITWVRFPFKAADKMRSISDSFSEYVPLVEAYANKGVGSLIVLNQQTVAGNDAPWLGNGDWAAYADRFAQAAGEIASRCAHLGDKVAYEIWNEGDNPETPWVSVFVPPDQFALVLDGAATAIRAASPQSRIIFGGLSTGPAQASAYVQRCQAALNKPLPIDGIGLHPYGRWPIVRPFSGWGFGTLDEAFSVFQTAFPDTPLWLTEIGIPGGSNPLGDEHFPAVARYLRDCHQHIVRNFARQVPVIIWFAWSDNMENAGIVKSDGSHKTEIFDTYAAIRDRTLPGLV